MAKKRPAKAFHREAEVKEFDEEVIQIDRVTRVVKGGRRLRFRCLVAIGDRKGRVGIGIGKATEVVSGIKKAIAKAKKSLLKVPITNKGSIPHEVKIKHKSARLFVMPATSGTGVIAGGSLRKILSLAGVKNVLSKNYGTNNKVVTAQATMIALKKLHPVRQSDQPKAEKPEAKKEKEEAVEAKGKPPSADVSAETPVKEEAPEGKKEETKFPEKKLAKKKTPKPKKKPEKKLKS